MNCTSSFSFTIDFCEVSNIYLSKEDNFKTDCAAALSSAGLIKNPRDGVRLLAKGTLKDKIEVVVAGASKAAVAAVEGAGGSVTRMAAAKAAEPAAAEAQPAD